MSMIQTLKYALQRLTRGWDDRLLWDMSEYLDPMILATAKYHREQAHGYPAGVTKKKWYKALDIIIEGFGEEPDWKDKKKFNRYWKQREKAQVLLAFYWDDLWD